MVDVDRRMAGLTPAHAAGLRRLSARASAVASSAVSHSGGLLSFRPLAESVLSRLRIASVPLRPGLSDAELARLEAELTVSLPPDLRVLLSLGLPSAPGFPDWRPSSSSSSCPHLLLRAALDSPTAAAALQVARGSLWPRSWGSRPVDPNRALSLARAALRRSPILIPVFDRCYIPCRPCLAGNPIFYVDEHQVFCCGFDLADFFLREPAFSAASPTPDLNTVCSSMSPLPSPALPPARRSLDAVAGRTPRWIEFWSDAASDRRRRNSSSSSSSSGSASPPRPHSERFVESRSSRQLPGWVDCYLGRIGSVLRSAGWEESEISEIVGVPPSGIFDVEGEASMGATMDAEAALDALLVKANRCSDSLRRAGWSADEVSDVLGFHLLRRRRCREERHPVRVPPEIALKAEKLVEAVP